MCACRTGWVATSPSRFKFQREIKAIAAGDNTVEAVYDLTDPPAIA